MLCTRIASATRQNERRYRESQNARIHLSLLRNAPREIPLPAEPLAVRVGPLFGWFKLYNVGQVPQVGTCGFGTLVRGLQLASFSFSLFFQLQDARS